VALLLAACSGWSFDKITRNSIISAQVPPTSLQQLWQQILFSPDAARQFTERIQSLPKDKIQQIWGTIASCDLSRAALSRAKIAKGVISQGNDSDTEPEDEDQEILQGITKQSRIQRPLAIQKYLRSNRSWAAILESDSGYAAVLISELVSFPMKAQSILVGFSDQHVSLDLNLFGVKGAEHLESSQFCLKIDRDGRFYLKNTSHRTPMRIDHVPVLPKQVIQLADQCVIFIESFFFVFKANQALLSVLQNETSL